MTADHTNLLESLTGDGGTMCAPSVPVLRPALVLACFVGAALAPAAAHAGGYVTAGIGGTPDLRGELAILAADGRNLRVGLGRTFGPASIEAGLSSFGLDDGRAVSGAVSVRLQAQLLGALGLYARGGVERTWVRSDRMDLSGDGYLLGVGLDFAPAMLPAAIWVEVGRETTSLSGAGASYDGAIHTAMIGVRVGI
jgi:hypothetical protein